MLSLRTTVVVLAAGVILGVQETPGVVQPEAPVVAASTLLDVISVEVQPAVAGELRLRHPIEMLGWVTGELEVGLARLPGVVPNVGGRGAPPGLAGSVGATRAVTGSIEVSGTPELVRIDFTLCEASCRTISASAPGTRPEPALDSILLAIGQRLGREHQLGQLDDPQDSYARMMTGRAAAIGYGIRPPVRPALRGHVLRDPVSRARFLDPSIVLAQWEFAREQRNPRTHVWRGLAGALTDPPRPVDLAALAEVLTKLSHFEEAADRWRTARALAPDDSRFLLPAARTAIAAGDVEHAHDLLAALDLLDGAVVAQLRAELSELTRPDGADDDVLSNWQRLAPTDTRPVRRRIHRMIRERHLDAALSLVPELHRRGAETEADALTLALKTSLGSFQEAAELAHEQGHPQLAKYLMRRDSQHPAVSNPGVLGRVLLASERLGDDPEQALSLVDSVLDEDPWHVEALAVRVQALTKLDRHDDLVQAQAQLSHVDPDYGDLQ